MSSTSARGLLAAYVRPQWPRALLLGALLLAGIASQLLNPQLARLFIDDATAGAPSGRLWRIGLAFTVVALLTQAATIAETFVADDLGWRTTNALRSDLTSHVLGLDESFHVEHGAGELMERIDGDVSAIAGFFSRFVVSVVGSGIFLVGVLALLVREDWRVGGVLVLFAAGAVAFLSRAGGFVARRSGASRQAAADLSNHLEERLGGLVDIKANGAAGHACDELDVRLAERVRATRAAVLAGSLFTSGVGALFVAGTGAALLVAVTLLDAGAMSAGGVFLVFRYTAMLRMPLDQLARHMNSFQQATGAMVRVRELLSVGHALRDGPDGELPGGALSVELTSVSFSYGGHPVLDGVSWRLEPGEVLGVLGRTGAGKTTMSRLLFRLYDADAGEVLLGGVAVRRARIADVQARVGLVTQDVQLFDGTLRDNVALFDPGVPDDALDGAFAHLGLGPWLRTLTDGWDTRLGPTGRGLSAGEAQLVALARAFLRDPGLVVLDEPSSRLDPVTERLLEVAVSRLLEGRTGILIAHRLHTVERADHILILDGGRVAELGRRADLVGDPASRLSQLLRVGIGEVMA